MSLRVIKNEEVPSNLKPATKCKKKNYPHVHLCSMAAGNIGLKFSQDGNSREAFDELAEPKDSTKELADTGVLGTELP